MIFLNDKKKYISYFKNNETVRRLAATSMPMYMSKWLLYKLIHRSGGIVLLNLSEVFPIFEKRREHFSRNFNRGPNPASDEDQRGKGACLPKAERSFLFVWLLSNWLRPNIGCRNSILTRPRDIMEVQNTPTSWSQRHWSDCSSDGCRLIHGPKAEETNKKATQTRTSVILS